MRYNQLGRTGLYVSEICLGTMTFGGEGFWKVVGTVDEGAAAELVKRSLDAGVNFIDTADVYSEGRSEELLGKALKSLGTKRSDVVIATKVFGSVGKGPNDRGASRGHIHDGIKRSLERLQLDHVDLYQIHADDSVTPVEETMRALDDLVREGLVRYVGVSNWLAWKIAKANTLAGARDWSRFESVQAYYSIAGRDLERDLVPMMQSEQVGCLVWSPLAGGLLSGKFGPGAKEDQDTRRASFDFPPVDKDRAWKCVDAMREVAKAHDTSVARVALAWILSKPFVTSVIIGAKRPDQLDDNLAAADLKLTEAELGRLDEVSALPKEYPGWMTEFQGRDRVPQPFAKS